MEEVKCKLVKTDEEPGYAVVDGETTTPVRAVNEYKGRLVIALPDNSSNRKYFDAKRADEAIAANGYCELTYKPTIVIGERKTAVPNAKLIEYLTDDLKAEYLSIVERARAAMEADRKKPLTEAEKLQKQIERARAKLAELEAAAQD